MSVLGLVLFHGVIVYLRRRLCLKCGVYMPLGGIFFVCFCFENVPLEEFMYLVFTRMPGESYRKGLRSLLLCLCDVFRALINSLVC